VALPAVGRFLGHELTDVPPQNFTPEEYIISLSDVYNALICINVHKAPEPDEIPNWLFKSNANTL
jgi:hypothetical protein